ncbi:hypothetical protein N7540_003687 [Penicillium herquei]|nr:hypothetical protein N7540_003687 [Penicillium herquei]
MGKFTQEIQNFEAFPAAKMPIIKVALLDDGINLQKANFNVRVGRTFNEMGDTGLDHYYVDPGQHGTIMGRLITDMCCNMHLYVARIERSPASGIPHKAAAAAVKWALRENVDIISMSWTIPKNDSENCFKDAIAEAVKENKLLFCALREEENALIHDGYHPVGLPQVFKIGSATRAGNQVNSHSGDYNHVDFILPGLDVLDDDEGCKSLNGSSVATALASGLAALILYCAELVDQDAEETGKPQKYAQSLRDISKMKLVFKRLSDQSHNRRFPEVQRFFNIGKSLTIDEIKDLIIKIAPT